MRNYVFTINNPSFSADALPVIEHEKYVSWQLEEGESGTRHVQGYLELTKSCRIPHIKKYLPTAHLEARRGTREQARDYTRKDESRIEGPWERGDFSAGGQGKRTDLDAAIISLKEGGMKRVATECPTAYVKYSRGLRELAKELEVLPLDSDFVPKPWQKKVLDVLATPSNDRQIYWITDPNGGKGKSRLARHLIMEHQAVQLSGRIADMAYMYDKQPIVIFDITRAAAEHTDHLYTMAENLKNGIVISTKYETCQKIFKPPHVIFFSNSSWNRDKWSHDRVIETNL